VSDKLHTLARWIVGNGSFKAMKFSFIWPANILDYQTRAVERIASPQEMRRPATQPT